MATDLKNVIIDNWNVTICALGDVDYWSGMLHDEENETVFPISYGWCLKTLNEDLHNSGMGSNAFQYTDAKGGDLYTLMMVGTDTEIDKFIEQYHHLCDTFNTAHGNTQYDHLYPNSERMDRSGPPHRRVLKTTVLASRNNKAIYT